MKKYLQDNPAALYYAIAVFVLFFAALVSSACGIATTLPTAQPVKSRPLILMPTMSQQPTAAPAVNWIVNCATLNVRAAAGMSSPVIGDALKYGAQVVIIGLPVTTADGAQWIEIVTADNGGLAGWVNMRYLEAAR